MDKIKNAVSFAYRFLAIHGTQAKGWAEKWGWWFGVILLALVTLLVISLKTQSSTFLTITGVVSVLLVLIIYYGGNTLANLITAGAGAAGKFKEPLEKTAEEAKKLFRPLLTVSMVTSFLVFMINVWGFNALELRFIQIIAMFFLTLSIAGVYFQSKAPWAGRVVVAFTILSAVSWYAKDGEDPLAYQLSSWFELVGSASENIALNNEEAATASKLAMATSKAVLYQKSSQGMDKDNSKILLAGDVVQVFGKAKKVNGEKFIQIAIRDADGSIANGKTYFVQASVLNKKILVYPNAVEPKCAVAEKKVKNGKLFYVSFLTGEPVELSLVALGEMYNFRGVKSGELHRNPENTPGADSLVEAPIGTDLYNLTQTVMTLQAPAGKTITIAARKPSAYEKTTSENWYKEKLAAEM